ncbi:disease resistance protein RPV1-like [Argentina anserina]|uniref:disease resistance protein RPV1-like n=1 Tax=Argentina anserina TaxID=57926 RepID=UPI002176448C|nr:disease resistance protein RPV1-like [Potentilla anserina]
MATSSGTGVPFPPSSEPTWEHDVFLSFRGKDTRRSFTSHLYQALKHAGVRVYFYTEQLGKGDVLGGLLKTIERSKIYIVVFSENFASSEWCLLELAKIMECRSTYGLMVLPVFYHVEPSDVRYQKGSFAKAFAEHEVRGRSSREEIDMWRRALKEAASLSGWNVLNYGSDAEVIREIVKTISKQLAEPNPEFHAESPEVDDRQLVDPEVTVARFPVGIKSRVDDLVRHLNFGSDKVRMVGIFGVSGLGKTTIAKAMYNQYHKCFDGACFLVNVRGIIKEPNGLISLQEQLHDVLETKIDVGVVSAGVQQVKRERRMLVMIDDIDDSKQLDQLAINRDRFGSGSRIVVITREDGLLKQLKVNTTYLPRSMNKEEANELFSWHAFGKCSPDKKYSEHSRTVVSYVGGLPLYLMAVGNKLNGEGIEMWQQALRGIAIKQARILEELLLYCYSLFPTGYEFRKDELVQLWIAEGFIVDKYAERMEDTGISYFSDLENEGYFLLSRSDFRVDFDLVSSVTCNSNNLYELNTDKADVVKNKTSRDHYSKGMDPVSVSENIECRDDSFRAVDPESISQDTASQAEDELKAVDEPSSSEKIISLADSIFETLDVISVSENTLSPANDLRAREMVFDSGYTASELDYLRAVDANLNGASATTRHLSLTSKDIDGICFGVVEKLNKLRTLLFLSDSGSSITHVPRNFFWSLKLLRTLKLRGTHISELPSSIRNVKELRYLDVSYTPITRLPESVTYLHNLQTLKLRGCVQFDQLPKDLEKLTKLRHIELDIMRQLDSLPTNLGNLTHLQTLSAFLIDKDEGCHIGQLKNLNDLKGALCISRLENVMNVEEVVEASLVQKKFLDRLELRWSHLLSTNKEEQEEILEWLEPHGGLKELQIQYFGGSKLPTWISSPSFAVLVAVTLYRCKNCTLIPSMGQLPALKVLSIMEMNEVTEINHQFFRNGQSNDQAFPAFPKLERLEIDIMLKLKEWKELQTGDLPSLLKLTVDSCPELETLPSLSSIFSLKQLEFRSCPKLQPSDQLPDSLQSLMIVDCPRIKEWFHEGDGEEWSKKHRSIWLDEEEIKF